MELIKELSDIEVCADVPTGFDDRNNFILFNNSTGGSPDFGSQACCTKYGYRWVPNSTPISGTTPLNLCKPRQQTNQPT